MNRAAVSKISNPTMSSVLLIIILLICILILLIYWYNQQPPEPDLHPASVSAVPKGPQHVQERAPSGSRWSLEEQERLRHRHAQEQRDQSRVHQALENFNAQQRRLIELEERSLRETKIESQRTLTQQLIEEKRSILVSGDSIPVHQKWKTCQCEKCKLVRENKQRLRECSMEIIESYRIVRGLRRENGEQPAPDVLDLHYLREEDAIACVTNIMDEYRNDIGTEIGVITGRGNNSEHGAIIRNAVELRLIRLGYSKDVGYRFDCTQNGVANDGKLIVTIRRRLKEE